jgi:hypothetical protein
VLLLTKEVTSLDSHNHTLIGDTTVPCVTDARALSNCGETILSKRLNVEWNFGKVMTFDPVEVLELIEIDLRG